MKPTLVTDFKHHPRWLDDLSEGLQSFPEPFRPLIIWVRDKQLRTSDLPLAQLRALATEHPIELRWSLSHHSASAPGEWIHVPDDQHLRDKSSAHAERRIFSCHCVATGRRLLEDEPADQILLSPWAKSISKASAQGTLDHDEVIHLSRCYPKRVNVISGLTPEDEAALRHLPFASLCFMGSANLDLGYFLERLQACAPED
jgi:hypothetical protein